MQEDNDGGIMPETKRKGVHCGDRHAPPEPGRASGSSPPYLLQISRYFVQGFGAVKCERRPKRIWGMLHHPGRRSHNAERSG
jgi:hypothetical protein